MKSNMTVINDFLGAKNSRNRNLKSEYSRLINYSTCLAEFCNGTLIINDTKYSASTSKIQDALQQAISETFDMSILRVQHVNKVPINASSLIGY